MKWKKGWVTKLGLSLALVCLSGGFPEATAQAGPMGEKVTHSQTGHASKKKESANKSSEASQSRRSHWRQRQLRRNSKGSGRMGNIGGNGIQRSTGGGAGTVIQRTVMALCVPACP